MIARPEANAAQADLPALQTGISCFSTLGCPELSLVETADLAREFHIPHLELRALENSIDLPSLLTSFPGGWSGALDFLHAQNVSPRILGTSLKLIGNTEEQWNELLAFAELAQDLEAPWLRVFSGGTWGVPLTSEDFDTAAASIGRWRQMRARHNWRTDLLVETHDSFSASAPCRRLLDLLDLPVSFLWDSHHTWRLGGEAPSESWSVLAPHVRHVHVKDSIGVPSARHPFTYVLPGEGEMPLQEVFDILSRDSFVGTVSLEWEKMWHPYLPPLSTALAACRERGWL